MKRQDLERMLRRHNRPEYVNTLFHPAMSAMRRNEEKWDKKWADLRQKLQDERPGGTDAIL